MGGQSSDKKGVLLKKRHRPVKTLPIVVGRLQGPFQRLKKKRGQRRGGGYVKSSRRNHEGHFLNQSR